MRKNENERNWIHTQKTHIPEQAIEVPKISFIASFAQAPGSLGADGGTVGGSVVGRSVPAADG